MPYVIRQNLKRIEHTNPVSGHTWSTYEPIPNSYSVYGPKAFSSRKFKSEKAAQEYIDFLIKFKED